MTRMLLWEIDATAGADSAWVSVEGDALTAEGRIAALLPHPFWLTYRLETAARFVTVAMDVEARWGDGSTSLVLRNEAGRWTANGTERADLAGAEDVDLAACPLTNVMPIRRYGLHREPGAHEFLMAFIEVPALRVVPNRQRYSHVRDLPDGGAVVRYESGSFRSDLTVDEEGFVEDYPQLGRRVTPRQAVDGIRAAGPGSSRPG
ncbi:MAG TPA: putative glycolipid-binding domain-containing protein [Candidatus Limnocylindrales bacterium]